jgi:hypothetical protein
MIEHSTFRSSLRLEYLFFIPHSLKTPKDATLRSMINELLLPQLLMLQSLSSPCAMQTPKNPNHTSNTPPRANFPSTP